MAASILCPSRTPSASICSPHKCALHHPSLHPDITAPLPVLCAPRQLVCVFFILITFSRREEREGTGALIHGCDRGGHISERSTGVLAASCWHALIHLRSGAAHAPFSRRQTTQRKMAFKDTKAPCGGDLPIIAQGCRAGV